MRVMLVLLLSFAGSGVAEGQSNSITLGDAVLRLGMSEAEVKAEIDKHPPLVEEANGAIGNMPGNQLKEENLTRYTLYGNVSFTHGRLSRVEKHWKPTHGADTDVELASAVYGAALAVAGTTPKICSVYTRNESEPDQDYRETTIECNSPGVSRSVHVFIKTLRLSKNTYFDAQVSEVLEVR